MSMFKIGEIVRVREDLNVEVNNGDVGLNKDMEKVAGGYAIVTHVNNTMIQTLYNLLFLPVEREDSRKLSGYAFSANMLEKVDEPYIASTSTIIHGQIRDITKYIAGLNSPKKYYLKAEGAEDYKCYLNRDKRGVLFLDTSMEGIDFHTNFTDEEIERMPKWAQALERIEVENE